MVLPIQRGPAPDFPSRHPDALVTKTRTLLLPARFDFDEEADVLYVSFERPQGATESELTEDGVLMRYRGGQLVGVTILNARKRLGSGP